MQYVTMPTESDTIWQLSLPGKYKLCSLLADGPIADIKLQYSFLRKYPIEAKRLDLEQLVTLSRELEQQLFEIICEQEDGEIEIAESFNEIIRLQSSGRPIIGHDLEVAGFKAPLILRLNNELQYWTAQTRKGNEMTGIKFFVISDQYSPITLNYSVITFYVSIVLFVGSLIKVLSIGSARNIGWTDMKRTEYLETLCAGIYVSRMIGDIKKEEELYYELIDILRSAEITKMLTGNFSFKHKIE
jgi:hypothetical protein